MSAEESAYSVLEPVLEAEARLGAHPWLVPLFFVIHDAYPPRGMDMMAPHNSTCVRLRFMLTSGGYAEQRSRRELIAKAYQEGGAARLKKLVLTVFDPSMNAAASRAAPWSTAQLDLHPELFLDQVSG
jgi:hypothetical protein